MHLACAVWTPEVQFENPVEMQGMRLDDLTADRTELRCGICKQVGRLGYVSASCQRDHEGSISAWTRSRHHFLFFLRLLQSVSCQTAWLKAFDVGATSLEIGMEALDMLL